MIESPAKDLIFITKLTEIILENLENESFGIKDLADKAGISHYRLRRRLQSITGKSISQFIRETRLNKAFEILQNEDVSASEVSYKVGFGSASYFNTCFNEFFGYPPGKINKRDNVIQQPVGPVLLIDKDGRIRSQRRILIIILSVIVFLSGIMYLAYYGILKRSSFDKGVTESNYRKSIAVLPFKNLNDSATNQYFIDGVMEEILTNLSKIHYLRVVSRTSVEQFRSRIMTTSEIAKKLKVAYLLEGSGQKSGNKFCLRIQLIEASKDSHIWAKSYEQEVNETRDIFAIQSEVAQLVASELKATITQEERQLIDKIPTTNLTAYDFCLRAKEANSKDIWPGFNQEAEKRAAALYHKALEYDSTYAQAYTGLAEIVWIRLDRDTSITDINTFNKYLDSLLVLTDIALSYDDKLAAAYNLRGVYYYYKHSATKSEAEYDKAIRINPNDVGAYWRKITNLYMDVDLVKTLEAIQKITSLSHGSELLGNLRNMADVYNQAGFPEKGDVFSLEALKLDGDSVMYSNKIVDNAAVYLGDYKRAIEYYEKGLLRDSTDAGVLGYLGGLYLRLGKYQESLKYYKKYISLLRSRGQTKPPLESYIGYAYLQNGYRKEADFYFDKIIESLDNPFWRYRNTGGLEIWAEYTLAGIYACRGDKGKAYEHLKMFDQIQSVGLQWVTSIKNEPLFNSIRNEPEFQKIVRNIEARYQTEHERVRKWLEEKGEL